MARQMWKVGDLAKQTGLTVRTLHHYDQIGLFSPSKLTESGHRLYTKEDIAALQQIISLKQLGFALDEIKQLLKEPDFDPEELIRLQISRLSEQITAQEKLRAHLRELSELLNARENVTTGHMLKAIQMQKVNQSEHFSPKQRDEMMKHYKSLGKNKLEEYDLLGEKLIKKFRLEMENGTPPDHPVVRNLAKQWKKGIEFFTRDSKELNQAAESYYQDNPEAASQFGMDEKLYQYIVQAMGTITKKS